jgi:hypothetical protein
VAGKNRLISRINALRAKRQNLTEEIRFAILDDGIKLDAPGPTIPIWRGTTYKWFQPLTVTPAVDDSDLVNPFEPSGDHGTLVAEAVCQAYSRDVSKAKIFVNRMEDCHAEDGSPCFTANSAIRVRLQCVCTVRINC